MKSKTINVRLDKRMNDQIENISKFTGESKSSVLRATLLHNLTSKLNCIEQNAQKVENTTKKVFCQFRPNFVGSYLNDYELNLLKKLSKRGDISVSSFIRKAIMLYAHSSDEEYIQEPKILERVRKKNPPDERLSDFIRDNAKLLTNEVAKDHTFDEDSFQDTILLFITDPEASKIFGNGKLVAHFKYRYNMLLYRNTMSERERRGHANDQQTKEDREEE